MTGKITSDRALERTHDEYRKVPARLKYCFALRSDDIGHAALPVMPLSQPAPVPTRYDSRSAAAATSNAGDADRSWRNAYLCAHSRGRRGVLGHESSGQLGDGTTNQSAVPVAVQGLSSGVMSLTLVWGATCALTTFGSVYCWGGLADGSDSSVPVQIKGLGNQVVQLAGRRTALSAR